MRISDWSSDVCSSDLDQVAPRVGSARYFASNGSRGLTTLQRRDAEVDGIHVTLSFPAKSGKRAFLELDDEDLANAVAELAAGRPRAHLLAYQRGRRRVPLTPGDVNAYVRALTGGRSEEPTSELQSLMRNSY